MAPSSLLSPVGYHAGACGYCCPASERQRVAADEPPRANGDSAWGSAGGPRNSKAARPRTSRSYGCWGHDVSPADYERLMLQNNWRRSGRYLYKPDNLRTCCPHLTIRLEADRYTPGKKQRRALTALYHEVTGEARPAKHKGKHNAPYDMQQRFTAMEAVSGTKAHALQVDLFPATLTDEKYRLFRRYQIAVHREPPHEVSSKEGFERFLVSTPLRRTAAGTQQPVRGGTDMLVDEEPKAVDLADPDYALELGTYHHEYRFDGKLIAVGVLDILPTCVSSVYLFYDPTFEHLQLGKVSAMREILLTRQLARMRCFQSEVSGTSSMRWYCMGYYIHECQKMVYKASYKPSELLDLCDGSWHSFPVILAPLEGGARFGFGNAQVSSAARQHALEQKRAEDQAKAGTPKSKTDRLLPNTPTLSFLTRDEVEGDTGLCSQVLVVDPSSSGMGAFPLAMLVEIVKSRQFAGGFADPGAAAVQGVMELNTSALLDCVGALGKDVAPGCALFMPSFGDADDGDDDDDDAESLYEEANEGEGDDDDDDQGS